jgi:glycosyltransferase involved in cell wall biosynthesis
LLSIIIPTYNRCLQLEETLSSFKKLQVDSNLYEILIIDNGSKDATYEVFKNFKKSHSNINIKYFYDDIPGLLTGRHRGAKESIGDILTFIDDDVLINDLWLSTIIKIMNERDDVSLLTGPNLPKYETKPPSWLKYFWSKTIYGGKMCIWLSLLDLNVDEIYIHPNYVWGLNFTIRKSVFINLGGFHPDNITPEFQMFQGDGETGLTMKAFLKGNKALYNKNVMLHHQIPSNRLTFDYFDKRAYYEGVCNSFTDIRNNYFKNDDIPQLEIQQNVDIYTKFKKRFNILDFSIMNFIKKRKYNKRFSKKRLEGYAFHNKMFATNSRVNKWVLKNDYFEYNFNEI